MIDYYISLCLPIAYILIAVVVAKAVARGVAQALCGDLDRRETEDLVISALFTVIIGAMWPLACVIWMVVPKDPKTGRKFPT
ncbi:hypothetical protein ACFWAP_00385 [Streptomyces goshikiensis]|uniref:hypothetical protein n=1 Tax=Streptomyces goshikiensis TaxID=1942 RepID=UPI0036541128